MPRDDHFRAEHRSSRGQLHLQPSPLPEVLHFVQDDIFAPLTLSEHKAKFPAAHTGTKVPAPVSPLSILFSALSTSSLPRNVANHAFKRRTGGGVAFLGNAACLVAESACFQGVLHGGGHLDWILRVR